MAVWGLDVEQVKQLATQLTSKAHDIQTIQTQLTTQLHNTAWTGPDADRFRKDWESTHAASLKHVIEALQNAGNAAKSNAAAQEQTSNA